MWRACPSGPSIVDETRPVFSGQLADSELSGGLSIPVRADWKGATLPKPQEEALGQLCFPGPRVPYSHEAGFKLWYGAIGAQVGSVNSSYALSLYAPIRNIGEIKAMCQMYKAVPM